MSDSASYTIRLATPADDAVLETLIPLSARTLQLQHYAAAQIEAALGPVFAVDRQLIADGTYFVAELEGRVIACGGWSRRDSHYGAASGRELDPAQDPARMRAFFVHPLCAAGPRAGAAARGRGCNEGCGFPFCRTRGHVAWRAALRFLRVHRAQAI